MSIVEPDRHSTRKFLSVVCPCGRALRAAVEKAGQEISCWECHQRVYVPFPRSPERAYRIITDGLSDLFDLRWFAALFLGAALLTGLFCLPGIGIPATVLVLTLGAVGYGELIRQSGIDVWDFDDWKRPGNLALRIGVAALFGLGMASPLLLSPGGIGHPPRFNTLGLLLGLVASMVLPLAMFLIYARDGTGPLGWKRGRKLLLRHPVATLLALMLIPIGMVAAELTLIAVTSWQGMFPFLNLDMYPGSEYFARQFKIPKYGNYAKPELPDSRFFHLYLRRLHQGFTMIGTLPSSLTRKTDVVASPWTLDLDDQTYLRYRALYTQLSTMVILFFLALQSFWLGAISTLDSQRSSDTSST
jgi:hypothetical protein